MSALFHSISSLLVVAATADRPVNSFADYVSTFGRSYQPDSWEFVERAVVFDRRMQHISNHNDRSDRLWTAAVNDLTDRTDDELAQLRGWRHVKAHGRPKEAAMLEFAAHVQKPKREVDWRGLKMAADVPNQGACGSCWAVAATSMLQGRLEVTKNESRIFSTQQLVDCVPNPRECGGTGGCQGATVELAMGYVEAMGLQDAHDNPYHARDLHCKHPMQKQHPSFLQQKSIIRGNNAGGLTIGMESWHKLPENKALPLMLAVMNGPVAISVAASEWGPYDHGIFDGCSKDAIVDHAVVLFGYGGQSHVKYWTLRNSWGGSWGENGFIRLLRQDTPELEDSFCGKDDDPAAGLACKPYPKSVRVCGMCGMLYDSVVANFKQ